MKKISIRKKINPCQLSSGDLPKLAQIIYEPVAKEVSDAEKEWQTIKLPLLLKRIEEHNNAIKEGKPSYFGYTSVQVDNPDPIIKKEKENFMNTEKGFKSWNPSLFKIEFKDTTLKSDDPEIINGIDEVEKIKSVEYKAVSASDTYNAVININKNQSSYYEIEGTEETLIRAIKDKLFEFFETREFDKLFWHGDSFKIPTTLILSGTGIYTFYSLINKIDLAQNLLRKPTILWISIFVSFILFIWLVRLFYRFLDLSYPYLTIENKNNRGVEFGIAVTIIIGLLTNLIYELIKWAYIK